MFEPFVLSRQHSRKRVGLGMGEGCGHVPTQKCFSIGHLVSMSGSSPGLGWVLTSLSTSELPVTTIKVFFIPWIQWIPLISIHPINSIKARNTFVPVAPWVLSRPNVRYGLPSGHPSFTLRCFHNFTWRAALVVETIALGLS